VNLFRRRYPPSRRFTVVTRCGRKSFTLAAYDYDDAIRRSGMDYWEVQEIVEND